MTPLDLIELDERIKAFTDMKAEETKEYLREMARYCSRPENLGIGITSLERDDDNSKLRARELQYSQEQRLFDKVTRGKLREAESSQYLDWLRAYMLEGHNPTHFCDVPIRAYENSFKVAEQDFRVSPLNNNKAFSSGIIVPKGIRFEGDLGNINLYVFDGSNLPEEYASYRTNGPVHIGRWVPVFRDTRFAETHKVSERDARLHALRRRGHAYVLSGRSCSGNGNHDGNGDSKKAKRRRTFGGSGIRICKRPDAELRRLGNGD